MSLLETILRTAVDSEARENPSKFPVILNSREVYDRLKLENEDESPVKRVVGWEICERDAKIVELENGFHNKLRRRMKNSTAFSKESFLKLLNTFLEKVRSKTGVVQAVSDLNADDPDYTSRLIKNLGEFLNASLIGLILENCVSFELWNLVGFIVLSSSTGLVVLSSVCPNLVEKLIRHQQPDLLIRFLKTSPHLRSADILMILKYFLSRSSDHLKVKKEWESQTLSAIEKISKKFESHRRKNRVLTTSEKTTVLLLSIAYDGFTSSEICLHHFFAALSDDSVAMSSAISRLENPETVKLFRYLMKWLKKYSNHPELMIASKVKDCELAVPSAESIFEVIGLVVDEHFVRLVLHKEFVEVLKEMQELMKGLVSDANIACSVANLVENMVTNAEGL